MKTCCFLYLFVLVIACKEKTRTNSIPSGYSSKPEKTVINTVGDIPVPDNYQRITEDKNSFGYWMRDLKLKKDKTVYLFNGEKKQNQSAQYAVIDISRSKTDLQQCADAVMRLRAEYLFAFKKYDSIRFMDFSHKWYNWNGKGNRGQFDNYLQQVFGWCGSASLEQQLPIMRNFMDIKVGDVLIKGGFPGHAMIVADMATNKKGEKIFMLVQGYQPAQDIHLVVNPDNSDLSPWYKIPEGDQINTPEWVFYKNQLHKW